MTTKLRQIAMTASGSFTAPVGLEKSPASLCACLQNKQRKWVSFQNSVREYSNFHTYVSIKIPKYDNMQEYMF